MWNLCVYRNTLTTLSTVIKIAVFVTVRAGFRSKCRYERSRSCLPIWTHIGKLRHHGFSYIGAHIVLRTLIYGFYPVMRPVYDTTIVSFVLFLMCCMKNYTEWEEDFDVWLNGLVITKDIGYLGESGLSHWICLHKETLAEVFHTRVNGFMITKCVGNEMLGKWICVDWIWDAHIDKYWSRLGKLWLSSVGSIGRRPLSSS